MQSLDALPTGEASIPLPVLVEVDGKYTYDRTPKRCRIEVMSVHFRTKSCRVRGVLLSTGDVFGNMDTALTDEILEIVWNSKPS